MVAIQFNKLSPSGKAEIPSLLEDYELIISVCSKKQSNTISDISSVCNLILKIPSRINTFLLR